MNGAKAACRIVCLFLLAVSWGVSVWGHTPTEHRRLAGETIDAVVDSTATRLLQWNPGDQLAARWTFADVAANPWQNDANPSHYQVKGQSILEQLRSLDSLSLRHYVDAIESKAAMDAPYVDQGSRAVASTFELPDLPDNAVAAYLVLHIAALRAADQAGRDDHSTHVHFRSALMYEALSEHFLADAFSAGHMLAPVHAPLAALFRVNVCKEHDYFSQEGTFVVNGRNDLWRAYGDSLLEWYPASYAHVKHACVTSLREVIGLFELRSAAWHGRNQLDGLTRWDGRLITAIDVAFWLEIKNGDEYYSAGTMPSLLELPMPVSAAWGVRTDSILHFTVMRNTIDTLRRHAVIALHGDAGTAEKPGAADTVIIHDTLTAVEPHWSPHRVKYYPQLVECHDPSFDNAEGEVDVEYYSRRPALPVFLQLGDDHGGHDSQTASSALKTDMTLSSVHFTQTRDRYPTFDGGVITTIGGWSKQGWYWGAGWSWALSSGVYLGGSVFWIDDDIIRWMVVPALGMRIPMGELFNSRWAPSLRSELGVGIGLPNGSAGNGPHAAISLTWLDYNESKIFRPWSFPFAITPEIRYEYFGEGKGTHGIGLTLTAR